jgi:dTMP kinase
MADFNDIKNPNAIFVVIEGSDGTGKTTVAQKVVASLLKKGVYAKYYREPGGDPISEEIREVALKPENSNYMQNNTRMLLMLAARFQLMENVIIPFLEESPHKPVLPRVVVLDRYFLSTLIHQVYIGKAAGPVFLSELEKLPRPNKLFILNARLETTLERQKASGRVVNHYDNANLFFKTSVYDHYQKSIEMLKKSNSVNWYFRDSFAEVVNENKTVEETTEEIVAMIIGDNK